MHKSRPKLILQMTFLHQTVFNQYVNIRITVFDCLLEVLTEKLITIDSWITIYREKSTRRNIVYDKYGCC